VISFDEKYKGGAFNKRLQPHPLISSHQLKLFEKSEPLSQLSIFSCMVCGCFGDMSESDRHVSLTHEILAAAGAYEVFDFLLLIPSLTLTFRQWRPMNGILGLANTSQFTTKQL